MNTINRRHAIALLAGTTLAALLPSALMAAAPSLTMAKITVHKTPWCGCCTGWSAHLREAGYDVTEIKHEDLAPIKARLGVPVALESCHTAEVEGYAIEGHVPVADITTLLARRPKALGLAVPGMPMGSPGMERGVERDAYDVMLFDAQTSSVFAHYEAR
jgi:hypothetical protein